MMYLMSLIKGKEGEGTEGAEQGRNRRGIAGRNRTEGAREEGREEGRKGPVKSVKPRARKVASPPLLMHRS